MTEDENNRNDEQDGIQEEKSGKKSKHPLPYTLEVSFTIWRMIIVVVTFLTGFLSWWNGAAVEVIGLRSAAAVVSLGGIAVIFNSLLSKSMLEAVRHIHESGEIKSRELN